MSIHLKKNTCKKAIAHDFKGNFEVSVSKNNITVKTRTGVEFLTNTLVYKGIPLHSPCNPWNSGTLFRTLYEEPPEIAWSVRTPSFLDRFHSLFLPGTLCYACSMPRSNFHTVIYHIDIADHLTMHIAIQNKDVSLNKHSFQRARTLNQNGKCNTSYSCSYINL